MLDHLGIDVSDIARSTEFYLKALAPLGYDIVMEFGAAETGRGAAVGFGVPGGKPEDFQSGKPSFWIGAGGASSAAVHVAFLAPSRDAVHAFYHGGARRRRQGQRPAGPASALSR